jgi:demethylmenaquinone methyltransferase/2-methoxy-6-polyprenyl-1,4-benzoquinol methylase
MDALLAAQVDPLARDRDAREQRVDERLGLRDERVDRAVVVDVGVDVEQPRAGRERVADRLDRRPLASLREVRNRFEQGDRSHLGGDERPVEEAAAPQRELLEVLQSLAPFSGVVCRIISSGGRSLRTVKAYYEARAREYDDWWLGRGLHAGRERPGWFEEVVALLGAVASLPPARTLDVACGTGFLTRHLHGEVTCLDQSASMLEAARAQVPGAAFVQGDALELPFADGAFERLFTGHFYGHLEDGDRERFLAEARRVAGELVVVDSALREGVLPEERQERELKDGTRWQVYKRYFTAEALLEELGGGETLLAGTWFTAVRS